MKYYLLIIILSLSCLRIDNITVSAKYFKDHKMIPKILLGKNIILERLTFKNSIKRYWIESDGFDRVLDEYAFNIYSFEGRFLGRYYFSIFDYKEDVQIKNVEIKDFLFSENKNKNEIIINHKSYLFEEYIPRDVDPNDFKRLHYYEWVLPVDLPIHSILIEDTEDNFDYIWRVYIKSEKISKTTQKLTFIDYTYNGDFIWEVNFLINTLDTINLNNYSFYKSLFRNPKNEYVLINNGIKYNLQYIDDNN